MKEILLGQRPPDLFIQTLQQLQVMPLSVGKVIVATWEPHHTTVLEVIKESGIEHHVIFNKGAAMILPPGINKAKGLVAALKQMNYSMHNVMAVATIYIGSGHSSNIFLYCRVCNRIIP